MGGPLVGGPMNAGQSNSRVDFAVALHQSEWESDFFSELVTQAPSGREFKRCVDSADLLADVLAGLVGTVIVDVDFAGLDASTVSRVSAHAHLIGLCSDLAGESKLRQWGVEAVVLLAVGELRQAARSTMGLALELDSRKPNHGGQNLDPGEIDDLLGIADFADVMPGSVSGNKIVVCGAVAGAGATTVATGIAEAFAAKQESTMLIDADLEAPCLTDTLALTEDSGGLLRASRLAERGTFTMADLASTSRSLGSSLRFLAGLPAPHRKPEVKPVAMMRVCEVAQHLDRHVVVDLGAPWVAASPGLDGPELQYALAAQDEVRTSLVQQLHQGDALVVVVDCSPIAIAKAMVLVGQLGKLAPDASLMVLINRLRPSVLGVRDMGEVVELVQQVAPDAEVVSVRHDLSSADKALMSGQTITEVNSKSVVTSDLTSATSVLMRKFEFVGASL